jgi:hypothetical protein
MLIDFEKAFDSISWKFLYQILTHFNFGLCFKKWVKVLNKDSMTCIIQSGFLLKFFFQIQWGCKQGHPLSPYLLLLCGEILALSIIQNDSIKVVILKQKQYKLTQYANDTTLILDGNEESQKKCYINLKPFRVHFRSKN